MKTLVFALTALLSSTSFAGRSCTGKIEDYFRAQGYQTRQAEFQKALENGDKVYYVRTNLQGGDAAHEVLVDFHCNILAVRELWSE
nr:hypothetical protein CKG001_15540 [Bdellovibrio sp. CKG001]